MPLGGWSGDIVGLPDCDPSRILPVTSLDSSGRREVGRWVGNEVTVEIDGPTLRSALRDLKLVELIHDALATLNVKFLVRNPARRPALAIIMHRAASFEG